MLLCFSLSLSAQSHFTFTSNTGNNMSVIIRKSINPAIQGLPIAVNDEIGVFTPQGLCVGARTWSDSNIVVAVWGDDGQTPQKDGMSAGDTLFYRVWDVSDQVELAAKATNQSGFSTYSVDGISRLASLNSVPVQPQPTAPGDGDSGIAVKPALAWTSCASATSYGLIISSAQSFTDTIYTSMALTINSHACTSALAYGTSYYWKVCAMNGAGSSAWSTPRRFKTIIEAPPAPALASPSDGAPNISLTPLLTWHVTPRASNYTIQVSANSSFSALIINQTAVPETCFTVPPGNLEKLTKYFWKIRAVNAGGESDWSEYRDFTTETGTSVNIDDKHPSITAFTAYPSLIQLDRDNQVFFYATISKHASVTVTIHDALGNIVYKNNYDLWPSNNKPVRFGLWDMHSIKDHKKVAFGMYKVFLKITDNNRTVSVLRSTIGIKK